MLNSFHVIDEQKNKTKKRKEILLYVNKYYFYFNMVLYIYLLCVCITLFYFILCSYFDDVRALRQVLNALKKRRIIRLHR